MIKFSTFITEARDREAVGKARGDNMYKLAVWPHKSILDQKIAQHKDRATQAGYSADKARQETEKKAESARRAVGTNDRASGNPDNPVTQWYGEKASKLAHKAKREKEAYEAGVRTRDGTEIQNKPENVAKRKAALAARNKPEAAKEPEKKSGGLWSRLRGK